MFFTMRCSAHRVLSYLGIELDMTEITTASLSKALHEMQINVSLGGTFTSNENLELLSQIIDSPEKFGPISDEMKNSLQWAKGMKSILGPKGLKSIWAYQDFREKIQKNQVENDVSAIEEYSVLICAERFTYLDFNDQLKLLGRDYSVLKNQVKNIVSFFLRLARCPSFCLFERLDDDKAIYFATEALNLLAESCSHAWIYSSSNDWTDEGNGQWSGTMADRDPPDVITLGMEWGDPQDPSVSRHFELIDLSKLPCGREYYDSLLPR